MKRANPTLVLLLPLLLAACGGTSTPGSSSVSVSADKATIALTPTGASATTDASTNFIFTNKAGGAATDISSATLKFGTSKPVTVSFPNISVTSGFSCADGSTSGCSTANLQFTASTITKALKDADLFGSLPALNGGQKSFPVEVNFVGVANPLTFTVNVGAAVSNGGGTSTSTPATSPAPVVTINTTAAAPYTGNLNVTVSGNFDATSTVERLVLQTIDVTGNVDSTSYVSNQPTATFSVDTSKFPDGNVLLKAIAITKLDANNPALRGESVTKTITVQNITPPVIALASPSDGSTVTTANMPVQITITRKNSAFTIPGGQIVVNLLDYRGQQIATQTIAGVQDNVSGSYNTSFDVGGLPADIYTLSIKTSVAVAGGAAQTVTTIGKVTTKSVSGNPPASVVRFPIAITSASGVRSPALVDSGSGFFATVSDDIAIGYVEARVVGPYLAGNIETDGTKQCQSSGAPLGTPVNVLLLNVLGAPSTPYQTQDVFISNLDIEGSTYVPNNIAGQRYDLRVTVADGDGNRNIQCVPVVIQRGLTRPAYSTNTSYVPDPTPKKPTYSSGTWTLGGVSNNSRVAAVVYAKGTQTGTSFFASVQGGSVSVSQNFAEAGTYEVKWLVEDTGTGVVTTVNGGAINVGTNP